MDHRLGCGDELRYRDQCYFGNLHSLEATWTKRSFPDRDWNEYDFHAAYGDCDECGRLWYDGGTGNYFICFAFYPGGRIFGGLAIQLLAIKKAWEMLSLAGAR